MCNEVRGRVRLPGLFLCLAVLLAAQGSAETRNTAQNPLPLYGVHGVSPLAVRQGILGTCYFHASVAAVATVAPQTIRNAISQNPGGGYRVRFFQGPEETVYPEDVEYGRAHSYDHSEGAWVTVLMRAYAQRALRLSMVHAIERSTLIPAFVKSLALAGLEQSGPLLVAYDRAIRAAVNQDGDLNRATLNRQLASQLSALGVPAAQAQMLSGFLAEEGFYDALTLTVRQNGEVFGAYRSLGQGGIPVSVLDAFLGRAKAERAGDGEKLVAQLRRLHDNGVAMVATTRSSAHDSEFQGIDSAWWVAAHAYSVLDYNEAAQTVNLRNPWGVHPTPDGAFTLPLALFLQAYESYAFSQTP